MIENIIQPSFQNVVVTYSGNPPNKLMLSNTHYVKYTQHVT